MMDEPGFEGAHARNGLAPGVPADYCERIYAVEETHWWHRGMRAISEALLGERLRRTGQRLLDGGCGTGGFLRWALARDAFAHASGVDVSATALSLARRRVPSADLAVAPLEALPHPTGAFDLVVANDVLQHVHEARVEASVREFRRVLRPQGALLVRTAAARRARRERADWRVYDRSALLAALAAGGFRCERLTYANLVPSLWAAARGRFPRAPDSARGHGVPAQPGGAAARVAEALLRTEARYLRAPSHSLPYGHTLFALALPT